MGKRANTNAKGRRIVLLAKAILEARGATVEVAPNVVRWWRDKASGRWLPRTVQHDYFGVWDMLVNYDTGVRAFMQVTTFDNLGAHREKIRGSGVWLEQDVLLGYKGGRGRHFRVCPGPTFELTAEQWTPVKAPTTTEATP